MVANTIKITIEGKKYVAIPATDYRRLVRRAGHTAPSSPASVGGLPRADAHGRREALATIDAMIAHDVHQARQEAGFTQAKLAEAAGLRVETISRIESGKHAPTVRTLKKIGHAMGLDW